MPLHHLGWRGIACVARKRTTEPARTTDPRARRSVLALQASLLTLLEYKSLDQISLKEISDAAGLSHMTFFRRFGSKEELFQHIATEEVRNLLQLGQVAITEKIPDSARGMCAYVQARRKLWRTLLTGGAVPVMRQEFMRISAEIAATRGRTNPWLPLDLAVPFVASGIFEILAWWMRQPDDYPVQNVITIFDALIVENVGQPRTISLMDAG